MLVGCSERRRAGGFQPRCAHPDFLSDDRRCTGLRENLLRLLPSSSRYSEFVPRPVPSTVTCAKLRSYSGPMQFVPISGPRRTRLLVQPQPQLGRSADSSCAWCSRRFFPFALDLIFVLLPRSRRHQSVVPVVSHQIAEVSVTVGNHI